MTFAPSLFQQELKRSLLEIAAHPELGVRVRLRIGPNARAVFLPRSGYVVFYDIDRAASKIQVLRVRHGKRRPLLRRKRR